MAGDDFVLDTEMVQGEDVLSTTAFKSVKIFNLEMILDPLQF